MEEFFDDEDSMMEEIRCGEKKGPKLKNFLSRKSVDKFELDMLMNEYNE